MKKPVTSERHPPIPDTWYLVKTTYTSSGWAVAYYNEDRECWVTDNLSVPITIESYIPEPLNEIE